MDISEVSHVGWYKGIEHWWSCILTSLESRKSMLLALGKGSSIGQRSKGEGKLSLRTSCSSGHLPGSFFTLKKWFMGRIKHCTVAGFTHLFLTSDPSMLFCLHCQANSRNQAQEWKQETQLPFGSNISLAATSVSKGTSWIMLPTPASYCLGSLPYPFLFKPSLPLVPLKCTTLSSAISLCCLLPLGCAVYLMHCI